MFLMKKAIDFLGIFPNVSNLYFESTQTESLLEELENIFWPLPQA